MAEPLTFTPDAPTFTPDTPTASSTPAVQFTPDAPSTEAAKPTAWNRLLAPFTDIFPEMGHAAKEANTALHGAPRRGEMGPVEGLLSTGHAMIAPLEMAASPVMGLWRSLLGHPLAEAETAVGGLINPEVAKQRAESGAAYGDAKSSVDTALMAARPARGGLGAREVAPAPPAAPPTESIKGAAVKIGDNVVEAPNHFLALQEAARQRGVDVMEVMRAGGTEDGFVTSTGRFVDRAEADRIASSAQQKRALGPNERKAEGGLGANELASEPITPVRPPTLTPDEPPAPPREPAPVVPPLTAGRAVRNMLIPDAVSPVAESAAADIRSAGGRAARDTETTRSALDEYAARSNKLDDAGRLELIDYIERRSKGATVPDPTLQPVADAIRDGMELRRRKIEALDSTAQARFVDDYYTHLWKDPAKAQQVLSGPAKEGSGRFLKERSIPTVAEGIAHGLEPVSLDPITTTMQYVQSMDRFIATEEVINKGLADGTLEKFPPGQQPQGWTEVNTRRGNNMPIYAPDDWARVYNNFVDRGFNKNADVGKIYDTVRNTSNAITSLELGLSGFHAATMVQEAMVNGVARAITELAAGRPIKSARALAEAPFKPITNVLKGREVERVYLGKDEGTPLTRQITDLLTEAGGRAKGARHAPDYQYTQAGSYWDTWKKGTARLEAQQAMRDIRERPFTAPAMLAFRQVGRVMQTVAKPLFEYAIPKLKNGAFYDNMRTWMESNPNATHPEQVKAARKIWDSIDNRFGEVVQDNIFWNKTLKQSLQVVLRSYSWTFGTIQEIGGGAKDLLRHPTSVSPASKHYSPKAAYVIALPFTYATLNAIYQKMKTGKDPESIDDVMRGGLTGGTQPGAGGRGEVPERVMMPGYMKDVYGWYEHPYQEAMNKRSTGMRMLMESASNTDWKNQPIRDKNAPTVKQVEQFLKYVGESLGPISVKQYMKGNKQGSNISVPEQLGGFRPAPTFLQDPEGYERMMKGVNQRDIQRKERYEKRQDRQYNGPQ